MGTRWQGLVLFVPPCRVRLVTATVTVTEPRLGIRSYLCQGAFSGKNLVGFVIAGCGPLVDFTSLDATISKVLLQQAARERDILTLPLDALHASTSAEVAPVAPPEASGEKHTYSSNARNHTADSTLAAGTAQEAASSVSSGSSVNSAAISAAQEADGQQWGGTASGHAAAQVDAVAAAGAEAGASALGPSAAAAAGLRQWEAGQVLKRPAGYVCLLGVAPECRRLGLGQALLNNALQFARSYG